MFLAAKDIANYKRDGYVLVENLFNEREVAALLAAIEDGGRIQHSIRELSDTSGKKARLALWHELGDDIWAAVSTNPRLVNNIRMLLREEIAFYHGKVMLKEPRTGGAWEWHQDFGYWYTVGFAFPRLMSAFVALDPATEENGCLQVLRGSHLLGCLPHFKVTEQYAADPDRVKLLEPLFERVPVRMTPGSVLFFHANLLHTSGPNTSDKPRRSFIVCYNALHNPQVMEQRAAKVVCPVSADDAILQFSPAGQLAGRN